MKIKIARDEKLVSNSSYKRERRLSRSVKKSENDIDLRVLVAAGGRQTLGEVIFR